MALVAVVTAVAASAVAAGALSAPSVGDVLWLFLLIIAGEWHPAGIWHRQVLVSLSSIIIAAAVVIVGPGGAVLVATATALSDWHLPPLKRVFNVAQFVLSAGAAGLAYVLLGGPVGSLSADHFPRVLLPFLAANLSFCLVNAVLLACVIRLSSGVPVLSFLRGVLLPLIGTSLGYGLFGFVLAAVWLDRLGPAAALLLFAPLLVARWVFAQYAAEQDAYEATVRTLVQAVETKDLYTRGHSERVSHGAVLIGRRRGLPEDRLESLRYAGLLHDVGKIGVATRLLRKTSRLDDDEFTAVAQHPRQGVEIVHDIDFLDEARRGILHHHERLDGRGYPLGLRGDSIPEFARVISVADAFDAMTSQRSYRSAFTQEAARAELVRGRGSQFDPVMVDLFLQALDEEGWEVAQAPAEAQVLAAARRPDGRASLLVDHDDPVMSVPPGAGLSRDAAP